jgi:hypothetical protein
MEGQDPVAKANQLHLQAQQRYVKINAHIKVYGTRNAETEQLARNGIEFVEAALKLVPDSAAFLNTYALLVTDGLGEPKLGLQILERAARLAPDDIQIQQNIRDIQKLGRVPHINNVGAIVVAVIVVVGVILIIIASQH